MGLNELFEEIVLLNVDKRRGEAGRIEEDVRSLGFTGRFSTFVVGKGKLLPADQYDLIDNDKVSDIWNSGPFKNLPNSYHAFRAFQTIIGRMKAKKVRSVLLLEDDVIFCDNFNEVLGQASLEFPQLQTGDAVYLSANHIWSPTQIVSPHLLRLYGSLCWHSVGLSHTVFDTILSWTPDKPIDLKAAEELHPQFNCYALWPSITLQKSGWSEVEQKVVDYTHYFKSRGNNHKDDQ